MLGRRVVLDRKARIGKEDIGDERGAPRYLLGLVARPQPAGLPQGPRAESRHSDEAAQTPWRETPLEERPHLP